MSLHFRIKKDGHDALTDAEKALYAVGADGEYTLQVEGLPAAEDTSGLKAMNEKLLSEKREAKRIADEQKAASAKAAEELARKNGDVAALEASYKQQIEQMQAEHQATIGKHTAFQQKTLIDGVVSDLSMKLGGSAANAKLLAPHIRERIGVEETADGFMTRVMKDGKPSALSIDDLHKEFTNNADFKGAIAAPLSQGTGGGRGGLEAQQPKPQVPQFGLANQDALKARAMELVAGVGE